MTVVKCKVTSERVDCFAKSIALINLKNHKETFQSNLKCRLINPAKSEIDKVSKVFIENITTSRFFIENIITKFGEMSSVNQWRETHLVITWFENTKNKNRCIFMENDIEEFYPLINYTRIFVDISSDEECTVKSLYFSIIQICV